jgi:hypothetical protein
MCWKKTSDLEEKVNHLEANVAVVPSTSRLVDAVTFNVITSQALYSHTSNIEQVGDSSCTHHMEKDTSLFSSLNMATKNNIFVVDYFSLDVTRYGDIPCRLGWIVNVYHVPSLSESMLRVSQLTQVGKIVEFCSNRFFVMALNMIGG